MTRKHIATLLVLIVTSPALAQNDLSDCKWLVSGHFGPSVQHLGDDIEPAMRASGFDETAFFLGPNGPASEFPKSDTDGNSYMLRVARRMTDVVSVEAVYGSTNLGITSGYHELAWSMNVFSDVRFAAVMVSASDRSLGRAVFGEDRVEFSVGAGPALYLTRAEHSYPDEKSDNTKIGALFGLEVRAPAMKRLFVSFDVQYRYVGDVDVGPFTASAVAPATVPEFPVDFNHVGVVFGLGARFQ